jgi:hypothetical protein
MRANALPSRSHNELPMKNRSHDIASIQELLGNHLPNYISSKFDEENRTLNR